MNIREYAESGMKSYEARIRDARRNALDAISEGDYTSAIRYLTYCAEYKGAIAELRILDEEAEVEER